VAEDPRSTRASTVVGIVTVLGSAVLRGLGILLEQPALSWLALVFAVGGVAALVALLVRRRRRLRGRR
jgi:hypothetical protein